MSPFVSATRTVVRTACDGYGVMLLGAGIVLVGVLLLVLTWRRRER